MKTPPLARLRLFQKAATAIFIIFMGLMLGVCVAAYSRRSGTTRQDMSQAQLARLEAAVLKKSAREAIHEE